MDQQCELLSLIGDVADGQDGPVLHMHVVLGLSDGTTRGGHLLEARVFPTLEAVVTETPPCSTSCASNWCATIYATATRYSRCYRAAMGIPLNDATLRLLDGKNYAVLATVNPDGSPQTSVIWVGRDGGDVLFSTVEGRVKHRNMVRDPRVSISVIDWVDPENYIELRGRVSMTPDVGRQLDTQLSWKYDGKDPGEDRPGAVRVAVRLVVEKATGHAA